MMEKTKSEASDHVEHVHHNEDNTEVAHVAAVAEHEQSLWQALKAEPKAVFWSIAVSMAVIMEGYDIVLIYSLFAQPAFAKRFGTFSPDHGWQIPAAWQSALGTAPTIGAIVGAFLNGYLAHKFGYRKVLLVSLVAITAFIFLMFFATSLGMLLAGLILCGIPWGVFATMAPAYASEVTSLRLRGYLTVYVNLCWAFGQLIAAGVLESFADGKDEWAYRIPFGLQWIFPLPLFAIIWFCPESPWWLVKRGRMDDARRSIQRLMIKTSPTSTDEAVALIQHTIKIEEETQQGSSYVDCFKGVNLRRTEIACMTFAAQIWCGSPLGGAPTYFLVNAGLSAANAFKFSLGGLGLASLGTIISWGLLSRFGRRTLYVYGLAMLFVTLIITGSVSAGAGNGSTSSYIQGGFVIGWLLVYYLTVGPVCYAIISEISAVNLRNKSVCLSRISYYLCQVIGSVIEPYMVNPNNANWRGKTAFFWAGTCLLFFIWAYFRLPESKDLSYEQLDILFNEHVGARHFSKMKVDAYAPKGERVKRA